MLLNPPDGSNITIEEKNGDHFFIIPYSSRGVLRIFAALFIVCWLGMWTQGWWFAARSLLYGKNIPTLFIAFWLCCWTVGGLFVFLVLYRLIRPTVPETLLLSKKMLKYDSGIPPFKFPVGSAMPYALKQFFLKRIQADFHREELDTLQLRDQAKSNRLTIDYLNKRIELTADATEIEREWLYRVLQEQYS